MSRFWLFGALMMVCSCSSQTYAPTDSEVRKLERLLARDVCIKDLSQWARYYEIDPNDPNVLLFSLKNGIGIDPGIYIISTKHKEITFDVDDRDIYIANGRYDVSRGKILTLSCGPNIDHQ